MTPNKFKGDCAICGEFVPARAGVLTGARGNWRVLCKAHAESAAHKPTSGPDHFDMMVEDSMRDACGC